MYYILVLFVTVKKCSKSVFIDFGRPLIIINLLYSKCSVPIYELLYILYCSKYTQVSKISDCRVNIKVP